MNASWDAPLLGVLKLNFVNVANNHNPEIATTHLRMRERLRLDNTIIRDGRV
jgi:hypothetical protein